MSRGSERKFIGDREMINSTSNEITVLESFSPFKKSIAVEINNYNKDPRKIRVYVVRRIYCKETDKERKDRDLDCYDLFLWEYKYLNPVVTVVWNKGDSRYLSLILTFSIKSSLDTLFCVEDSDLDSEEVEVVEEEKKTGEGRYLYTKESTLLKRKNCILKYIHVPPVKGSLPVIVRKEEALSLHRNGEEVFEFVK